MPGLVGLSGILLFGLLCFEIAGLFDFRADVLLCLGCFLWVLVVIFGVLFCWLVLSLLSVFVLPWFVMFGFIGLLGIGWFVD